MGTSILFGSKAIDGPRAVQLARACAAAAQQLGIGTICVYTRTGETARQIASYRPQARIVAFTASEVAYQRMSLFWGVTARRVKKPFESRWSR